MLSFLRKYQKFVFIIVTSVIIICFVFFGTYSATFQEKSETSESVIGHVLGGRALTDREFHALSRLIGTSPFDARDRQMPNLLNDGVIEREFLATGLGVLLCKHYFPHLKPEFDERAKKIQQYRPYVHPQSASLSAEGAWARYSPAFFHRFRELKAKSDQSTMETVALMSQLYIDQAMLPSEMLRQILSWEQNQQGVAADPLLSQADLSLFHFKSLQDWFGKGFVSLVSQFICNAAELAEERGYHVTREEIRTDLFQNLYNNFRQMERNRTPTGEEVENLYHGNLRALGLTEEVALGAWEKVMLFRRLFNDVGSSVVIDPLAYEQFHAFAKESVDALVYELPSALQLGDFRALLKFQVYLEAVALDPQAARVQTRLPTEWAPLDVVAKRRPELVEKGFELEWQGISKEELIREIRLKDTWAWQTSDAGWVKLKQQFPEVAALKGSVERHKALDGLNPELRFQIDQFARKEIVAAHPEMILAALDKAPLKKRRVGLRQRGGQLPFVGIHDQGALLAALEKNAPELAHYSQDGEHIYRIHIAHVEPERAVLTFAAALHDGTLDLLLDKRLAEWYPEVRRKDPALFQQAGGQWKPLADVKDLIGKYYYADLLKAIETEVLGATSKPLELPLSFYSNHRLFGHLAQAKARYEKDPESMEGIAAGHSDGFVSQWLLVKTEKKIERASPLPFSSRALFSLPAMSWSAVEAGSHGALGFYRVLGKQVPERGPVKPIEQGHQILTMDAKRDLMIHLLGEIEKEKGIDLSITSEPT
ncbi:MAG: hypothetical protein JSS61_06830 [Verrucomicrobia bacterium]|nr:hypothetical protein [Verrucomicrobiota bacterium]